jgi:hypothetical protein
MTIDADTLLLHLRICGVLLAVLVVVNLFVPGRLRWREEMADLSLVNRQIFQVHHMFIVLIVALCSALLLTTGDALLEPTRLSRAVLAGLMVFWGLRMLAQWFYYSAAVWRGSRINTTMHYAFSAVWVYLTATFAAALWSTLSPPPALM